MTTTNGTTTPKHDPPAAAGSAEGAKSTAMVLGTDAFRGALEPNGTNAAYEICQLMVSSGQFGLKTDAEAMAKAMFGRNIGMPMMQSFQRLHSIEGKIGVDAESLHALCLKSPLCEYFDAVLAECDAQKATFVTKRVGRPEQKFVYSIEDAEAAGLVDRGKDESAKKKANWNAYRKDMLRARCKATLAKTVYPDVTQGLYSKEELEALSEEEWRSHDPNEMVGEIVPTSEAAGVVTTVQAVKRDYAAEAEALKAKIRAAGSSRQAAQEVREAIAAWDGVEPWKGQVAAVYNEVREERKKAAAAAAPQPATTAPTTSAANPAPMPEGNLFGVTDAAKDASK